MLVLVFIVVLVDDWHSLAKLQVKIVDVVDTDVVVLVVFTVVLVDVAHPLRDRQVRIVVVVGIVVLVLAVFIVVNNVLAVDRVDADDVDVVVDVELVDVVVVLVEGLTATNKGPT